VAIRIKILLNNELALLSANGRLLSATVIMGLSFTFNSLSRTVPSGRIEMIFLRASSTEPLIEIRAIALNESVI